MNIDVTTAKPVEYVMTVTLTAAEAREIEQNIVNAPMSAVATRALRSMLRDVAMRA